MSGVMRAAQSGFTLLEILVALVVLGFLMVGLAQGVQFGLKAWDLQARQVALRSDMDATERVLRNLIAQADPGEFSDPATFKGDSSKMSFASRLPLPAVTGLPTRSVDVGLGVDARQRLVLRWSPRPHAERLTPEPLPNETVLLERVQRIEISYFKGGSGKGTGWLKTWNDPDVPLLVRFRLVFPSGDQRHWPEVVVGTMRQRQEE